MEDISNKDYGHAQQVWNVITPVMGYEKPTLGNYYDVYFTDGCFTTGRHLPELLRHVFRTLSVRPSTLVHSAWAGLDSCLESCTKIKLELLTDLDMFLMFEKGIRGGITQAVHRYAKANNHYIKDLYNPE